MEEFVATSESHLRTILGALCQDPYILAKATEMAAKLKAAPSSCGGSDLLICIQCKQPFSVLAVPTNECRYHDGEWKIHSAKRLVDDGAVAKI